MKIGRLGREVLAILDTYQALEHDPSNFQAGVRLLAYEPSYALGVFGMESLRVGGGTDGHRGCVRWDDVSAHSGSMGHRLRNHHRSWVLVTGS